MYCQTENVRRTADTTLDDMLTQPLLMPKRDVFSVELLDYATPGFCTNWKPYFGTIEDIAAFRNALYRDEKRKLEDMSFEPVKVYGIKQEVRDAGMYEHTNVLEYHHPFHFNRMYVIEKRFDSKKEMLDDLESYDGSIELSGWLDELFGDG